MVRIDVIFLAVFFCFGANASQELRYLGKFEAELPGFSQFYENQNYTDPKDRYDFIYTSFSAIPFTVDYLFRVKNSGRYLNNLEGLWKNKQTLTSELTWPREPSQIPFEVFGREAIAAPGGFLVPGKQDGAVKIIDISGAKPKTYDITSNPNGNDFYWFYHTVLWRDMNGDGRMDAVTARANIDTWGGTQSTELIWLEHPKDSSLSRPWKVHGMSRGTADTFVRPARLTVRDGATGTSRIYNALLTIGYFNKRLMIHWTENKQERWDDISDVRSRTIDTEGKFFDIQATDVNNDGRQDILTTINDPKNGKLVAYEVPDDFRTGAFKKHVLASGFKPIADVDNAGAPGSAVAFYPNTRQRLGKPVIRLSGDDEGTAYILYPLSQDPADWSYRKQKFFTISEDSLLDIVGNLAAADIDGDGWMELFLAAYGESQVHVYTFAPAANDIHV